MTNERILTCAITYRGTAPRLTALRSAGWRIRSAAYMQRLRRPPEPHSPSPHVSLFPWKRQTGSGFQTRRILNYGTNSISWTDLIICPGKSVRNICPGRRSKRNSDAIVKSKEYPPALQIAVCAMVAAAFLLFFFGGTLRDGFAAAFVGVLLKLTLYGLQSMKMKQIFSNIICSILSGLLCIFVCFGRSWPAFGYDYDRQYHAVDTGGAVDKLVP